MILPRIPDHPTPLGFKRVRLQTTLEGFTQLAGSVVLVPDDGALRLVYNFPADSFTDDGHGEPAGNLAIVFAANGSRDADGALIYTPGGK